MAKKAKAHARHLPVIYPDTVRPPPTLPDAASLRAMDGEDHRPIAVVEGAVLQKESEKIGRGLFLAESFS